MMKNSKQNKIGAKRTNYDFMTVEIFNLDHDYPCGDYIEEELGGCDVSEVFLVQLVLINGLPVLRQEL